MTARRIGLLGGSFDPPHLAHLALARLAKQQLQLDELRWLPAGAPWQKTGRPMTSGEHRTAMLAALLQGESGHVIDNRELQRSGPTYTIDTVRELQAETTGADWYFILGQDQYGRFDTWRDWPELLRRLTLAVAARDGEAPTPPAALAGHAHHITVLPLPRQDIAATTIREQLAAGLPPAKLAPLVGAAVAGYIDHHLLYPQGDTRG